MVAFARAAKKKKKEECIDEYIENPTNIYMYIYIYTVVRPPSSVLRWLRPLASPRPHAIVQRQSLKQPYSRWTHLERCMSPAARLIKG